MSNKIKGVGLAGSFLLGVAILVTLNLTGVFRDPVEMINSAGNPNEFSPARGTVGIAIALVYASVIATPVMLFIFGSIACEALASKLKRPTP